MSESGTQFAQQLHDDLRRAEESLADARASLRGLIANPPADLQASVAGVIAPVINSFAATYAGFCMAALKGAMPRDVSAAESPGEKITMAVRNASPAPKAPSAPPPGPGTGRPAPPKSPSGRPPVRPARGQQAGKTRLPTEAELDAELEKAKQELPSQMRNRSRAVSQAQQAAKASKPTSVVKPTNADLAQAEREWVSSPQAQAAGKKLAKAAADTVPVRSRPSKPAVKAVVQKLEKPPGPKLPSIGKADLNKILQNLAASKRLRTNELAAQLQMTADDAREILRKHGVPYSPQGWITFPTK